MQWIWIFCFVLTGLEAPSQPSAEGAIRKLMRDQVEAWNRGDIDAFMKGYWNNDSLMFIGKNGISYGYKTATANYKKNYSDTAHMGKLRFDLLRIGALSDGYYFVVGKWFLKRSVGDVGGIFSLVFRRIHGSWYIIADHTS